MSFGLSAAAIGGIAAGVGAVGGAVIAGNASKSAADTQANAADYAADLQNQQWQQTQTNLAPYLGLGQSAINPLLTALGYTYSAQPNNQFSLAADPNSILQQQFSYGNFTAPTEADAQATPGYQFTLDQGLKSVQNSAAARGLGTSGAALKGASTYATGLADSTYNDVYNRALSTYNTNFSTAQNTYNTNYNSAANNANRLMSVVGSGQNAAAGLGSLGAQTAANIGNTVESGANATAAGTVGSANALSSALGSVGNNALLYGLTQNNAAPAASSSTPLASGTTSGNNQYGFTI